MCAVMPASCSATQFMVPVVFDCDNAIGLPACDVDDALALLYLLARPEIDLLAVTTCFGNASLPRVTRATRRLLAYVGRSDLPLFPGAAASGTVTLTAGARHLVELTKRRPGQVTLVATGPLTNLAAALALDPGFLGRLRRVLCLGGTLHSARLGWRAINEVNFGADSAAAAAVLAAADCPVIVFPTTSCLDARIDRTDLDRLAHLGPVFRRVLARWLLCCRLGRGLNHFVAWDVLPAVWLTHPELFVTRRATVSLGPGARLMAAKGDRHELVLGLRDPAAFKRVFLDTLGTVCRCVEC